MNYILTEPTDLMPVQTLLWPMLKSLDGQHRKYNWLLTDMEGHFGPFWDGKKPHKKPLIFTGEELHDLGAKFKEEQIPWGVLSGFPKDFPLDLKALLVEPQSENSMSFWQPDAKPQYPGAAVEIVAWDSSFTILISKDRELSAAFKKAFPTAQVLEEFNRL